MVVLDETTPLFSGARRTVLWVAFGAENFTRCRSRRRTLDPHRMTYRARGEAQAYIPEGIVWRMVASAQGVPRGSGRHARHLSGVNLMIVRPHRGTYEAHVDDHWRS